jgi:DNA-binding IclR family transcriptional regulator
MDELQDVCALTDQEGHLLELLRHGPQSVTTVAEALRLSPQQTQDLLQRLDRKVGLVRLFRYDTLRYGLAE